MKMMMVNRLLESFTELESAILTAKKTLESKQSVPQEVIDRIDTYQQMLEKQRVLASAMSTFVEQGNWPEVSRHIKLINGLSEMIRDDAREIVGSLRRVATFEGREAYLS